MLKNKYIALVLAAALCPVVWPVPASSMGAAAFVPWSTPQLPDYEFSEPSDMFDVTRRARELGKSGYRVLMAFDVDNTILTTRTDLGSEQWFEREAAELAAKKVPGAVGLKRFQQLLGVNNEVTLVTDTDQVQPGLDREFASLIASGVKIIALTSRGPVLKDATLRSFGRNGYDFSGSFPGFSDSFKVDPSRENLTFERGVFLTAGQTKGQCLVALLKRIGFKPDVVIFTDNDPFNKNPATGKFAGKHHPLMKAAMAELGVPLIGYRYSRYDRAMEAYEHSDKGIAAVQLKTLRDEGTLVSNEEASYRQPRPVPSLEQNSKLMNSLIYGVEDPAMPDLEPAAK
ncbi:MAG: DUF2608 domain-containing protein [Elusimicrobia bacterium]|nr:DUF2608 domain-containing protein [Elusimicrobiota bacterium]